MNRELIVTLLRKQIQELDMMTEGFMEMHEYPASIMHLAKLKANDIQDYIQKLADLKLEKSQVLLPESKAIETVEPIAIIAPEEVLALENIIEEKEIEADIFQSKMNEEIGIESVIEEELSVVAEETVEVKIVELPEKPIEIKQSIITPAPEVAVEKIAEIETAATELPKVTATEHVDATHTSRNDLLSKADNSLSALIANKKVDDIKLAISIGDRFRFQRELFKGNGEEMNKTMTYLNQLASVDEALNFLQSKYAWENEAAEDFYQIVRRRFL